MERACGVKFRGTSKDTKSKTACDVCGAGRAARSGVRGSSGGLGLEADEAGPAELVGPALVQNPQSPISHSGDVLTHEPWRSSTPEREIREVGGW